MEKSFLTYELVNNTVQTIRHEKGIRIPVNREGSFNERRACRCGSLNIDDQCNGNSNSAPFVPPNPEQKTYFDTLFKPLRDSDAMRLTTTEAYLAKRNSQ